MSARLPAALQDAVSRLAGDVAPKELAARSASLTQRYRGSADSRVAVRDERDVAAYLTARLPATYAAMAAALEAVRERTTRFAPKRLLDAGAGPGTASWAAAEIWPGLESITMLDHNPHLLAAARTLARASPHPSLSTAQFLSADLAAHSPISNAHSPFLPSPLEGSRGEERQQSCRSPERARALRSSAWRAEGGSGSTWHYDLILAGYAFAELPAHARDRARANLWDACEGVFVIVEPGTPVGFATVLACRTALLAAGARMVAPCPAAYPCPILPPDWCHFAERLPRSRAHMRAKAAQIPFEDEKFSYVAVAREGIELGPIEARIIGAPQTGKPGIRLRLCAEGNIREQTVLKRDKPAYKAVARKKWGDTL